MGWLDPRPPPYAPLEWQKLPLESRGRMVCEAWATQGYGTPMGVYWFYGIKVALYVLGWALFCGTSPTLGGLSTIGHWWLAPVVFQKAIVWSMLFEGLGLGCGSGPLTGRHFPPIGGFRPREPHLSLWTISKAYNRAATTTRAMVCSLVDRSGKVPGRVA